MDVLDSTFVSSVTSSRDSTSSRDAHVTFCFSFFVDRLCALLESFTGLRVARELDELEEIDDLDELEELEEIAEILGYKITPYFRAVVLAFLT